MAWKPETTPQSIFDIGSLPVMLDGLFTVRSLEFQATSQPVCVATFTSFDPRRRGARLAGGAVLWCPFQPHRRACWCAFIKSVNAVEGSAVSTSRKQDPSWLHLAAIAYPPSHRKPLPPSAFCKTARRAAASIGVGYPELRKWLDRGCPGMQGYDVRAVAEWVAEHCGPDRLSNLVSDPPRFVQSRGELAELFSIHLSSVSKWEAKGCPKRSGYDVDAIRRWALENAPSRIIDNKERRSCVVLSETAEAILKRPPLMSDIEADLIALVLQRIAKADPHVSRRIRRMKAICQTATSRFNHPAIDFDEIPVSRREVHRAQLDAPPPEQFDDIPEEYQSDKLQMPLTMLLNHYKRERLVNCSPNTVRLMEASIVSFSRFIGRHAVVGDLRQGNVLDFLHNALDSGKYAAASVQSIRERLLALWRFAARKRWLPDFPEIPQVKCPERIPDAWTREEMQSLVTTAKRQSGEVGTIPAKLYWVGLFQVIYDTAERIGAVLDIRFDDITADGWLTVRAETRKGKTRDKRFKLRPETVATITAIRQFADPQQPIVFHWPLSPTYLYAKLGKLLDDAGLPNNRRTKFHKWRRTSASDFEAAGGNATQLLDHSSRSTTLKYLDPRVIKQTMPADIVPGLFDEATTKEEKDSVADELRRLLAKLEGKTG